MDFIVKSAEHGYDLFTPQGVTFDLADVEVWKYFGLADQTADMLVRGFPTFWEESGLAAKQMAAPSTLAETHRIEVLEKLAKQDVLPPPANPFASLFEQWQKENEEKSQSDWGAVFGDFFEGSELEGYVTKRTGKAPQAWKPPPISLDQWKDAACKLFDQLRKDPRKQIVSQALRGHLKQRHHRPGQAPAQRGARLASQSDLEPFYSLSPTNRIQWGPLFYDAALVNASHFCVAGQTQMGKTTLLRLLFQSIYQAQRQRARFVLYDAKSDLVPFLYPPEYFDARRTDEEIESEIYLLNPIDARATPWNIAEDASDDGDANELAEILFPAWNENDQYFARACRAIAVSVMDALRRKAGGPHWTFYDLLCALQPENLESVLSTTQRGQGTYAKYLTGTSHASGDTLKALAVKTEALIPAAYQWQKANRNGLSLRNWVAGDSKTIVLMSHSQNATAVTEINRILLGVLFRNLFSATDNATRTYFYLDEFEQLGRIDSILKAAQQGVSKRVNVAMCLQHDIGLLRKHYQNETEGLLSLCGFLAFLKIQGRETAQWASSVLGSLDKEQLSRTAYYDQEGQATRQYSETVARHHAPLVLPDEIQALPTPITSQQITAYFVAPPHPRYRGALPLDDLYGQPNGNSSPSLWPAAPGVKDFVGPDRAVSAPEDTFFTLYQLGFQRPDYQPPRKTEMPTPTSKPRRRAPAYFDFGLDN